MEGHPRGNRPPLVGRPLATAATPQHDLRCRIRDRRAAAAPDRFSLPPRHGKSELLSHWLEVWYLANWPDKRIGLASYAHGFAATWGRKVRNTIRDNPEIGVEISRDQSIGHNWQTSEEGGMMTSGVGGPFTGRGFDLLIIDDPIKNRLDANSPRIRQRIWDWWTSTARTRLEPGGSAIVVMTRWHEDDLVGRLLDPPDDTAEGDVVAAHPPAGAGRR